MKSIFTTLFAAACVLSRANAQSNVQIATTDLTKIKTLTDSLTATINSWNGTVLAALDINTASTGLVGYIQNATKVLAGKTGTFTADETLEIGAPTQELAYSVNASIAALINQKPAFEKINLDSTVATSLKTQLSASTNFSAALLGLVPSDIKPVADALNSQITDSLNQGIDCFNNMNASCNGAVVNPNRTYLAALDSGSIKATSAASRTANMAGFAALSMAVAAAVFAL